MCVFVSIFRHTACVYVCARPLGRGQVPADGRPGLPARRRALRLRPPQGPDHRAGPQPLPPGPGRSGQVRATAAAATARNLLCASYRGRTGGALRGATVLQHLSTTLSHSERASPPRIPTPKHLRRLLIGRGALRRGRRARPAPPRALCGLCSPGQRLRGGRGSRCRVARPRGVRRGGGNTPR